MEVREPGIFRIEPGSLGSHDSIRRIVTPCHLYIRENGLDGFMPFCRGCRLRGRCGRLCAGFRL